MTTRKKALKGLGGWLGSGEHEFGDSLLQPAGEAAAEPGKWRLLGVDQLQRGRFQPRQRIDETRVREMADSIRAVGVIEPLVVRPLDEVRYEILAGEMRWRGAQQAGLAEVPVVIRQVDDRTAAAIALIENLQRQDLNPMEEARGIRRLKDEFGLNQTQVAEAIGKSQSSISRVLGLLELSASVQSLVDQGALDAGHGKVLLGLEPGVQERLASQAVAQGWSVRELERRKAALQANRTGKARFSRHPDILRLERHMQARLGNGVHLRYDQERGKGRIEISFNSLDECNGLLEQLGLLPEE